ncbi:MAG: hypothetical protein ACE5JM_13425 [Armatimonadota bacterium]
MIPWKVIVTVFSVTAFGLVALAVGQTELAAAAAGALIGYLGKVNGSSASPATHD